MGSTVDEIDIWRSAKLYVDQHGDIAAIHAAVKADALLVVVERDLESQHDLAPT